MLSNTMIFSPVLIESARGKSSPVCHAFQIGFIYYYILNPIQGGLFEPPFWVCVCFCVCVWGGGGEGAKLLPYLNFSLTTARGMKLCTGYLQYNWVRILQIHSLLRSWINKNRQSWIKTRVSPLFFSESKQTE